MDSIAPAWDKRTWKWLIAATCVSNVGFFLTQWKPVARVIDLATPIVIWGDDAAQLVGMIGNVLQLVALPIVVCLLAQRRPLVWALAPGMIDLIIYYVFMGHLNDLRGDFSGDNLLVTLIALLVPALIGYGIRQLVQWNAKKSKARKTVNVEEGVWPPPPIR